MIAAFAIAASLAAPVGGSLRIVGDARFISLGARAGLRVGPVELHGGVNPIELEPIADDQVTAHTLSVAAGMRVYLPVADGRLFVGIDGVGWNEIIHDSYDELHRRLFAVAGVRAGDRFFYDVSLGPGAALRKSLAAPGEPWHAVFAFTVQGSVGIGF